MRSLLRLSRVETSFIRHHLYSSQQQQQLKARVYSCPVGLQLLRYYSTSRFSHPLNYLDFDTNPEKAMTTSATRQTQRTMPQDEARALLRSHFEAHTGSTYSDGWDKLWKGRDFLPWDRMVPSPALLDTLDHHRNLIGTATLTQDGTNRRKRALVPGCGRGVDVMLLQAYGYDVIGLDISETAVEACEKYAQETENEELYKARDEKLGKGSRKFVQGDFYADEWLKKAGLSDPQGCFELIYDYTVSTTLATIFHPIAHHLRLTFMIVLLCNASDNATGLGKAYFEPVGGQPSSQPDLFGISNYEARKHWWTSIFITAESVYGTSKPSWSRNRLHC